MEKKRVERINTMPSFDILASPATTSSLSEDGIVVQWGKGLDVFSSKGLTAIFSATLYIYQNLLSGIVFILNHFDIWGG